MSTYATLILISLGIGALVGGAGIGGFFMPPALTLVTGLSIHQGMATSLFTFIFTGVVGAIYFHRQGTIDWRSVWPVCSGAALTGFVGAWIGAMLSASTRSLVLAAVILIAGIYTLTTGDRGGVFALPQDGRRKWLVLAAIGAVTGFLSGLTGIGGPALSVPLMVLFGFSILTAIGTGQVLQIVGALSGTLANLRFGHIDYSLAAFISFFEILGVLLGAYIIHRVDVIVVKRFVGGLCLLAGISFIIRSF